MTETKLFRPRLTLASSSMRLLLLPSTCVYWHALQILGCHIDSQTHMMIVKSVSLFSLRQPFPMPFPTQLPLTRSAVLFPSAASCCNVKASLQNPHSATMWARQSLSCPFKMRWDFLVCRGGEKKLEKLTSEFCPPKNLPEFSWTLNTAHNIAHF